MIQLLPGTGLFLFQEDLQSVRNSAQKDDTLCGMALARGLLKLFFSQSQLLYGTLAAKVTEGKHQLDPAVTDVIIGKF
jgi:hypothetical protein